jgi:mono/diheme cytochrome c family protein
LTRPERTGGPRRGARGLAAVALSAIGFAGCTDFAGYDLDYILGSTPIFATMRSSVSFENHTMPRLPAVGTVPVASPAGEVLPTFTQAQLDSVGSVLTNPVPNTPDVVARGETLYNNQCFVCHGAQGEGNGPVVGNGRFPLGPTLLAGTGATRSDGYIYGIIRVGRGLMPAYGERISHLDRWAVVHYVRQLQQQGGGAAAGAAAPAPAQPAGATAPAAGVAAPAQGQPATPPGQ